VALSFVLGTDGTLSAIRVSASSGSGLLDTAAEALLRGISPVAGIELLAAEEFTVTIRYRLE
jgi:TonB family protein